MTQEEKARRYDEAIEISKKWRNAPNVNKIPTFANRVIEEIFPELKESEDERIREKLIDTFNFYDPAMNSPFLLGIDKKDIIAWLEKQGSITKLSDEEQNKFAKGVLTSCALSFIDYLDAHKYDGKMCVSNGVCEGIKNAFHNAMWDRLHRYYCKYIEKQGENCLVNFDEAEKEKNDFVSGQFIECRKSFDVFKEDNSYWLEYIGDDIYIGRSDNILNQKFHITPRQLFTLFTQQHCPKDNNVNEETNAPTGYGKYVDECLNEATKHFFSEGEDKYSVADLFYAGVRCGKSWFEKQGEQKHMKNIVETWKEMRLEVYAQASGNRHEPNYSDDTTKMFSLNDIDEIIEKISEQKPTDNIEPKFKVGDWIIRSDERFKHNTYLVTEVKDYYVCEDLKGRRVALTFMDVHKNFKLWGISDAKDGDVLAFDNDNIVMFKDFYKSTTFQSYCYIEDDVFSISQDDTPDWWNGKVFHPATKEQCDLLFQKMEEAGYMWDVEKKESKKIEQKSTEWYEKTKGLDELETYILSIVPNRPLDAVKVDSKNIRFLINKEQRLWSEEDKNFMYDTLSNLTELKDRYGEGYGNVGKCIGWLKSLKDRYAWKPNEEQLDALQYVYRNSNPLPSDKLGWNSLKTLELMYHDLKKLKG